MVAIDGNTIHITRGDTTMGKYNKLAFYFPVYNYETGEEEKYLFQLDDEITFVVFERKGYTRKEILAKKYTLKDLGYTEPTEIVEIPLTKEDTEVFELTNKAKTYWYDLVLNDEITMLGYDDESAKKIIVYPNFDE